MSDVEKPLSTELEIAVYNEIFPIDDDIIANLEGWVEDPDENWIPPSPLIMLGLLEQRDIDNPSRVPFRPSPDVLSTHDFLRTLQMIAWRRELETGAESLGYTDRTGQPTEHLFTSLGGIMIDSLASEMAIRRNRKLPELVGEVPDPTTPDWSWGHQEAELALIVHRYVPLILMDYDKKFGNQEATSLALLVNGAYRATRMLVRSFDTAALQVYDFKV